MSCDVTALPFQALQANHGTWSIDFGNIIQFKDLKHSKEFLLKSLLVALKNKIIEKDALYTHELEVKVKNIA